MLAYLSYRYSRQSGGAARGHRGRGRQAVVRAVVRPSRNGDTHAPGGRAGRRGLASGRVARAAGPARRAAHRPATGPTSSPRPSAACSTSSPSRTGLLRLQLARRTDQVAGRLDAVLIAARVAPLTRGIGLIPTVIVTHTEPFHISKAIATLDYVSTGRAGVRVRVSAQPGRGRAFGRRSPRLPRDRADPAADVGRAARRGGRLRRGDPAAVGQLGGRRRDPRRRDRPVHRPRTSCTTSTSPASTSASRARRSRPGRRRASRSCRALGHGSAAYRLIARSADVGFVTPRDAAEARGDRGRDPREQAGGRPRALHVFADLVVFLGRRPPPRPPARQARLDELAGHAYTSDATIFTGTPAQLADLLQDWQRAGPVRLPAAPRRHPRRPRGDHPGAGARAAAARRVPARLRGRHAARAARPQPPRQPVRHGREEPDR